MENSLAIRTRQALLVGMVRHRNRRWAAVIREGLEATGQPTDGTRGEVIFELNNNNSLDILDYTDKQKGRRHFHHGQGDIFNVGLRCTKSPNVLHDVIEDINFTVLKL